MPIISTKTIYLDGQGSEVSEEQFLKLTGLKNDPETCAAAAEARLQAAYDTLVVLDQRISKRCGILLTTDTKPDDMIKAAVQLVQITEQRKRIAGNIVARYYGSTKGDQA